MIRGQIVIATRNQGKVREMQSLLLPAGLELVGLGDFPEIGEVDETGKTFAENAILKASGYAARSRMIAIADDSGLEVDALGGAPGVLSARYGGPGASDEQKVKKLLKDLELVSEESRTARFVCAIAISDPEGRILAVEEGECAGRIALSASGSGGFGYDPVFVPDGYELTFAELDEDVKNRISHRAVAGAKIIRYLLGFTAV